MTAPIHKTCYRCGAAVSDSVDPADVLGGQHGMCDDCRLRAAAAEAAREWRWKNGVPDECADIPRENLSPAQDAAGANEGQNT